MIDSGARGTLRLPDIRDIPLVLGYLLIASLLVWWSTQPFAISGDSKRLIGVLLLLALVWVAVSRHASRTTNLVASLLIAGLLIGTLSAPAWRTSLEAAFIPVVAIALFVLIASAGLEQRWLTVVVVGAASLVALLAALNFIDEVHLWYEVISEVAPSSTFWERMPVTLPRVGVGALHPNETAMIGALALPLAVVGRRRFRGFRLFWSVAMVLIVGMVLATGSRAGVLSALTAVLLTVWLLRSDDLSSMRRWKIVGWTFAVLAVVAVLLFALSDYRPEFIFRGTAGDRLPLWEAGWEMFLDRPLTGNGSGAFSWLVDEYLGTTYPGVEARRIWNEAHNGYVQLLAEVGVIGVGVIGMGLWIVLRQIRLSLRSENLQRMYAAATLGGLAGFAIHSGFEASTAGLSPLIFAGVVVAGLFSGRTESSQRTGQTIWAVSLIGLPLLFLVLTIPAQFEYERGVSAAWSGEWRDAAMHFDAAAKADPHPVYERSATVAWSYAGEVDSERIEAASALEPFESAAFLNALMVSDPEDIEASLMTERGRLRAEEVVTITVGELHARSGRFDLAEESYAEALAMNPWLVEAEVWNETLSDTARNQIYGLASATRPCAVSDVFFLSGVDIARFAGVIEEACPPGHPANLALAAESGQWAEVDVYLDARLASVPEDIRLRRLAAISAEALAPNETAQQLAVGALLGDAWAALNLVERQESAGTAEGLARLLVAGYSPVIESRLFVYRYGAIRTRVVDRRLETPTIMLAGEWQEAVTNLHAALVENLR